TASNTRPVDHHIGHDPARPHADAETGQFAIPDCELLRLRLQTIYDTLGDAVVSHVNLQMSENPLGKHRGNTEKERKLEEHHEIRISSKVPIISRFLAPQER